MSQLPVHIRTLVVDAGEELRISEAYVEKINMKHKNSDPELVQVFYSLHQVCRELQASLVGVLDFIEKKPPR